MLSIFIPQNTLEDILIDNMDASLEPEQQDTWFKLITKQDVIYVSSWDEKNYYHEDDPLFILSDSYGVKVKQETEYIQSIPDHPDLVTQYWNGIFLLDITEDEAMRIQRDYGVICQSIDHMDASVLMDPGLRFSPEKGSEDYSWEIMLQRIDASHIPSHHLYLIDRYLFSQVEEFDLALSNVFDILRVMLPIRNLKCRYTITLIVGQQEKGDGVPLSQITQGIYELVPCLERSYPIDVEVIYLTHLSGLYTSTHNRCIITNYTITQVEHKLNAFEDGKSNCLQTILPQGLFTPSGLDGYCDSPHKTHDDVMTAIYDNIVWWVNNYLTRKSIFTFNGKIMNIKDRFGIKKKGNNWSVFVKSQ